jgi:hypothetical protein
MCMLCFLFSLVIAAMEKLPADRRCFRMIGGVLVERSVGEVLPAVKSNVDKVSKVVCGKGVFHSFTCFALKKIANSHFGITSFHSFTYSFLPSNSTRLKPMCHLQIEEASVALVEKLKQKESELLEFQTKHDIRIRPEDAARDLNIDKENKPATSQKATGVLA